MLLHIPQYLYQDSEWGDLLTTYNGSTITYDEIGNPTTYPLRSVGKYATLSWENGRQLSTLSYSGTDISYKYNDNGVRVSKTVNGVEHVYHVSGTQIIAEKWNNNVVIYLYDADGSPIGMQYRSLSMSDPEQFYTYWFEKNLQGDVIAIYSDTGSKIVSYAYDAWGNQVKILHDTTGSNLYAAAYNYITYRGYYYDIETCLYYLNSRYYDPVTKRFINADGYISTGQGLLGNNMFSYCGNNPVNRADIEGHSWSEIWEIVKEVAATIVTSISRFSSAFAAFGGVAVADGPLPCGDAISLAGCALLTGGIIITSIIQSIQLIPKIDTNRKNINDDDNIVIYRYGSASDLTKLTPTQKDVDTNTGLSFSTKPPKYGNAAKTTIGELNATGVVYAVKDGKNHVSVYPVNGTIEEWHNEGPFSKWSIAVKSVVVEWSGN